MTKYKRAFGNCEGCTKQHCAVWFVGSQLLCKTCRDSRGLPKSDPIHQRAAVVVAHVRQRDESIHPCSCSDHEFVVPPPESTEQGICWKCEQPRDTHTVETPQCPEPPEQYRVQPDKQSPLTGEWRHSNGFICCGTLRVMRSDFDTNPAPEFATEVLDWVVNRLNGARVREGEACECGHPKSQHEPYEDHDECSGCLGKDDPCCHFVDVRVPVGEAPTQLHCYKCGKGFDLSLALKEHCDTEHAAAAVSTPQSEEE